MSNRINDRVRQFGKRKRFPSLPNLPTPLARSHGVQFTESRASPVPGTPIAHRSVLPNPPHSTASFAPPETRRQANRHDSIPVRNQSPIPTSIANRFSLNSTINASLFPHEFAHFTGLTSNNCDLIPEHYSKTIKSLLTSNLSEL